MEKYLKLDFGKIALTYVLFNAFYEVNTVIYYCYLKGSCTNLTSYFLEFVARMLSPFSILSVFGTPLKEGKPSTFFFYILLLFFSYVVSCGIIFLVKTKLLKK